jgi:Uma2 family endonuclease
MATITETARTIRNPRPNSASKSKVTKRVRSEESVNHFLMKHKNYEFVDGNLEKKNMPNAKHSGIAGRLVIELGIYLKKQKIGRVYPEAHFQIGENKRVPDVAFVSVAKIPIDGEPQKFWDFAPDLAIEIVSPTDFYQDVVDKVDDYFAAGVIQVWVINPEKEDLAVFTAPRNPKFLSKEDTLTCDAILPEFRLKLSDIFID